MLRSVDGCDFGCYWCVSRRGGKFLAISFVCRFRAGCISEAKQAECFAFWSVDQRAFGANDILSKRYLATCLNLSGGSIWN